jgi:hypothetical protein
VHAHWARSRLLALAAATAWLGGGAPAQSERLRQIVANAIADLAEPAKSEPALRRLEALGPSIVPLLRAHLQRGERDLATGNVLYVLGRCGRAALPAVPELCDVLGSGDETLCCQAMWVLGRIAPFLSEEQSSAVRERARVCAGHRDEQAGVLVAVLGLGATPGLETLRAQLRHGGTVAACTWICAQADAEVPKAAELTDAVAERLQLVSRRLEVQFEFGTPYEAAPLAEAWLALTKKPLDALTARGLLGHWHPDQRRRAIAWLHDHGAALPAIEREDLVARLWDGDAQLVALAASALGEWGRAGMVGLAALRQRQRTLADASLRERCAGAADAIVAACADLAPADRAWLAAIDAHLRGDPQARPAAPPSEAARALAASMLRFAQWNEPATLAAVLELFDGPPPCDNAVRAVYGWLCTRDAPVAHMALAWLARQGSAVRRAAALRTFDPLPDECVRLARGWVAFPAGPTAIEAIAWFQSAGATTDELADLVESPNTRLAVRGLVEQVMRPTSRIATTERLRTLLAMPDDQPLLLLLKDEENGMGFDLTPLAAPVRTLAAIALADRDVKLSPDYGLEELVRKACGVALDGLPAWVKARRADGTLTATLDAIETDCRRRLGVPAELRWPTVTAAPSTTGQPR